MKRFGQVINIKTEEIDAYKEAHAAVWPEILEKITKCNIKNYSIYLFRDILFSYFEYHGENFESDMALMASDSKTQDWWALMKPMQLPVAEVNDNEWWKDIEEVFHLD